jgi:hypothetical protein
MNAAAQYIPRRMNERACEWLQNGPPDPGLVGSWAAQLSQLSLV